MEKRCVYFMPVVAYAAVLGLLFIANRYETYAITPYSGVIGIVRLPAYNPALRMVERLEPPTETQSPAVSDNVSPADQFRALEYPTILEHRAEVVQQRCRQMYGATPPLDRPPPASIHHTLLVDGRHKLIVCAVPKVASTNIRRTFLVLGHVVNTTNVSSVSAETKNRLEYRLKHLRSFSDEQIQRRLELYKKVIVVREPMERLVSAYVDKLKYRSTESSSNPRFLNEKKKAMRLLGVYDKRVSVRQYNVSFVQFIQLLIMQHDQDEAFDQHWSKYTDLCYPCSFQYNYVVKYETINEDMRFILRDIGARNDVQFPEFDPRLPSHSGKLRTADLIKEYFKTVPHKNIEQVKDIFRDDAFLFGYNFPDVVGSS